METWTAVKVFVLQKNCLSIQLNFKLKNRDYSGLKRSNKKFCRDYEKYRFILKKFVKWIH